MSLSELNSGHCPGHLVEALERDFLLAVLDPKPGERILEVGCGSGKLLKILKNRGLTVTGLESDQALASAARDRLNNSALVELGDPGDLPFEDNEFDLVLLGQAITQALDPRAALAEAGRVARKRVVVKTLNPLSWYGLCRRFQGSPRVDAWLGPWRLDSLARGVFGPSNMKRATLFTFPRAWLFWLKWLEMSSFVQRFPFGAVIFLRVDLRYTVRTRPLTAPVKPAALGPTPGPVRRQSGIWRAQAAPRPRPPREHNPPAEA